MPVYTKIAGGEREFLKHRLLWNFFERGTSKLKWLRRQKICVRHGSKEATSWGWCVPAQGGKKYNRDRNKNNLSWSLHQTHPNNNKIIIIIKKISALGGGMCHFLVSGATSLWLSQNKARTDRNRGGKRTFPKGFLFPNQVIEWLGKRFVNRGWFALVRK